MFNWVPMNHTVLFGLHKRPGVREESITISVRRVIDSRRHDCLILLR